MPESTAKKQLLEFDEQDNTPAKIIVQSDINSWLETNQKSHPNPPKFKISKRQPSKPQKLSLEVPEHSPNIQNLKKRREELLKSTLKDLKESCKKNRSVDMTKPSTTSSRTNSVNRERVKEIMMKLPMFHVNEFTVDESDRQRFQQINLIPSNKPFLPHDPKSSSRRSSFQKLKMKTRQDGIFNFELKKPLCKDILSEKTSKNHYTGFNRFSLKNKNQMVRQKLFLNQLVQH